MKISTFNINGIKARLPRLIEWLEQKAPDVACLQEIKTSDETFPIADIEAAGYGAIWHGQKGFNGVAILAKGAQPVARLKGLPDDPDPTLSRYIEAEINGVIVGSIYLPNGNPVPGPKFDYKLAWFDKLIDHAAGLWASEMPVVLAGDYNVIPTPSTDDVFSERAMAADALTQPESRSAFRRLCNAGWTDAVRTIHPHGPVYTFWDYQAGAWQRDAGFRIDHLMLSPAAADRLTGAGVDKDTRALEKASDHAPTWITLR
ncbi:exodeoxyribonuclease III [Sphingomonas sp. SRS2]|uniref:exodeoxyribonuclease III n=1 Tax=Sphingomonas sp. SRS2 TaxID=133190 RepID=UPI0006184ACC|nr:exodeoxyribonuclease III [Sphingomonas sp. SRS2]KKC26746.1 exodeoxyribonuclease III [Sphingomonas sp. SRS2]